jgi:hypothetical protein
VNIVQMLVHMNVNGKKITDEIISLKREGDKGEW